VGIQHEVFGWDPEKWTVDLMVERGWTPPAQPDGWTPRPVQDGSEAVSDPSEDGDVERLLRLRTNPASDIEPVEGTTSPKAPPSEAERVATDLVGKIRVASSLTFAQLAPGMAAELLSEVLAFALTKRWLAINGDRVVLGAEAPAPPAPPPRSRIEASSAWVPHLGFFGNRGWI
jgi:hypothetical protein